MYFIKRSTHIDQEIWFKLKKYWNSSLKIITNDDNVYTAKRQNKKWESKFDNQVTIQTNNVDLEQNQTRTTRCKRQTSWPSGGLNILLTASLLTHISNVKCCTHDKSHVGMLYVNRAVGQKISGQVQRHAMYLAKLDIHIHESALKWQVWLLHKGRIKWLGFLGWEGSWA